MPNSTVREGGHNFPLRTKKGGGEGGTHAEGAPPSLRPPLFTADGGEEGGGGGEEKINVLQLLVPFRTSSHHAHTQVLPSPSPLSSSVEDDWTSLAVKRDTLLPDSSGKRQGRLSNHSSGKRRRNGGGNPSVLALLPIYLSEAFATPLFVSAPPPPEGAALWWSCCFLQGGYGGEAGMPCCSPFMPARKVPR